MQNQNSYAEFILGTFHALLKDCACWYPELAKEFDRDYLRLCSAINSHGIRFVLETMPTFGKHLDRCLSEERLTPSNLTHFGVIKKGEVIPRLFRGLTLRVFDRNGKLRDHPDINAIRLLRQLLRVFKKLRIMANAKDSGNAVKAFYRDDMSVRSGDLPWGDHQSFGAEAVKNDKTFLSLINPDQYRSTSLCLSGQDQTPIPIRALRGVLANLQHVADFITSTLGSFDPHEWVFKHGPGSVAGQRFGSNKYAFERWPDRLESSFPFAEFAVANYAQVDLEPMEVARSRGFCHEIPAKMCAVPKTIGTPRLIASEPAALQWCQQAVRDYFYSRVSHTFISSFVDFRRQDKNGRLALEASHHQSHVTVDLSCASDMISCWHVERLFRRNPRLLQALQATRSVWIEQDICKYSPTFHRLRKYSTMGNATTFPVQSMFFLAIALACEHTARGLRVCDESMKKTLRGAVRIFGDDIIVSKVASGLLVDVLQTLGLRVNHSKTYLTGKFRESCGVEAYDGHDVTAVGILEMPRISTPSSVVSTVDVHNNLLYAGYLCAAAFVRKTARSLGYDKIREIEHGDSAFGWSVVGVPDYTGFKTRVNPSTQRREIRCLGPKAKEQRIPAEGSPGLLQFFTEAAKKVTSAKSTLGHLGRRPQGKLTLGWAPC